MAEELELTDEQKGALRAIETDVHAKARPLGHRLVDLEKELDGGFRSGKIGEAGVARLTAAIAALDGRLRFLHLEAHLKTRKLLTPHQVAEYDRMRGYGHAHTE